MKQRNLFLILAFISFLVVVLRAIHVPLFHDEVRTFNHYIKSGILSPFSEYRAANNHLVNSLLSRFSYLLFGDSPIALRLPNVLSFLVYSFFAYRIGSWFKTIAGKWTFFILLLFSFHFVSFFGLTRGYGIGFASLLAGIYFLGNFIEKVSLKNLIFTLIALVIALYSFFSLLLLVLISLGIVVYTLYHQRQSIGRKQWWGIGAVISLFVGAVGYAIHILFYYKGYGILWFGFLDGFWKTTVISLIHVVFEPRKFISVMEVLTVIFSVSMFAFYIGVFDKKKWVKQSNLFFVFFLLNILGIIVLALMLDINYPYQRTGLHLYLLFIGAFSFMIDKISEVRIKYFLLGPFFIIPVHFVLSYNLDYVSQWPEDTLPYSFHETIKNQEKNQPKEYNSSLYIEGTAISVWSYGVYKYYPELPICSSNIDTNRRYYDYIIDKKVNMNSLNQWYDSLDGQPNSDVILYKRKQSVAKTMFQSLEVTEFVSGNKDVLFANFIVDSLPSSSLWFDFETRIKFSNYPMHVYLVFSMENPETHDKYSYKFIEMDRLIHWNEENHRVYTELVNDLPQDKPVEIKVYLWNRFERSFEIGFSKLDIYSVEKE